MGVVEFELQRTVQAPIDAVFARLADITSYGDWMPSKGSILKRTELTSPGEPGLGTTYLDDTSYGAAPGEISEFEPPHKLAFHWWDSTGKGKVKFEGWPGYTLTADGPGGTVVRHRTRVQTHGIYQMATPVLRRIAMKERTATLEALAASFESQG